MYKKFVLFFLIFLLFFCKTNIIKKKELDEWNKEIKSNYITINDIFLYEYNFKIKDFEKINPNVVFQKNKNVRLELESVDDWLRIRAFDVNNTKKDYLGDVILYISLPEDSKGITSDEIKKIIFVFIKSNFKN